jgi:hypothetical protein
MLCCCRWAYYVRREAVEELSAGGAEAAAAAAAGAEVAAALDTLQDAGAEVLQGLGALAELTQKLVQVGAAPGPAAPACGCTDARHALAARCSTAVGHHGRRSSAGRVLVIWRSTAAQQGLFQRAADAGGSEHGSETS